MPIRKIADAVPFCTKRSCKHPEHDPPRMIVLPPGEYEHTCPSCHKTTRIIIRGTVMAEPRDMVKPPEKPIIWVGKSDPFRNPPMWCAS